MDNYYYHFPIHKWIERSNLETQLAFQMTTYSEAPLNVERVSSAMRLLCIKIENC